MPYTVLAGNYFFPFAYDKEPAELGPYGRRVLGDLVDDYVGESYYGWRAGISADGRWTVYVAGD